MRPTRSPSRVIATRKPRKLWSIDKEDRMEVKRNGSRPSGKGPVEWFTGAVRIDPLFQVEDRIASATVTFEPGARTAWHTHPLGQTLIVVSGLGWAQSEAGT